MRCALVLPGSASTADFVTRAFGPPLAAAGYKLITADPPAGPDAVAAALRGLAEAAQLLRPHLVGGVSLGAHLAARWAATAAAAAAGGTGGAGGAGLLLALPAWTGPPGPVAAASWYAAERVKALGVHGALAEARRGGVPWVVAELAAAWPAYGDRLAGTLRATASSRGPLPAELAAITTPVGIVAFTDDPLHPLTVAQEWARLLPRAALRTLALADAADDRSVLGAAALAAWHAASAQQAR